jgi:hypothetical protein
MDNGTFARMLSLVVGQVLIAQSVSALSVMRMTSLPFNVGDTIRTQSGDIQVSTALFSV